MSDQWQDAAAIDDAARMAAGIRAIHEAAVVAQREAAVANAALPPPEIADRPGRADQLLAQTVRCAFCKALPNSPCHLAKGRPMQARFHPGRLAAAIQAEQQTREQNRRTP